MEVHTFFYLHEIKALYSKQAENAKIWGENEFQETLIFMKNLTLTQRLIRYFALWNPNLSYYITPVVSS